jgi:hypothetical protein
MGSEFEGFKNITNNVLQVNTLKKTTTKQDSFHVTDFKTPILTKNART